MKKVGIHVLDYNGKIIDFISQDDGAILAAEMNVNEDDKTNTFDFTVKNERSDNLRKRNKIIVQDQNGVFHEYVIVIVDDTFEKETTVKCNASYLEDLKTAKPIPPGKLEANTTTQALLTTLADTGWEVSDETEYGGNRSTSWTAYTTPYDLINMLCTTYDMVADFYIELGSHEVEHRYVKLSKPNNAFKGKEIEKGVDLTNMTRTIDMSEVVTALIALSPEAEDGSRTTTVIKDDDAQAQFGLPGRYIWDVYEPESDDENMTLKRLTTLAETEMNKRNKASVSYEVSSVDISKFYSDVVINIRDIVRVKDRDFNPPLYIETEVVGLNYNWLNDVSDYKFGTVKEYEEDELRAFFYKKLDEITKKVNDDNNNINTIVTDMLNGTLEYYERKIFKGDEPPANPKDDTLWYDTTNPNVAVLRRYHNGEWINETVSNVKQIGGVTREQALFSELKNSFINLGIQHSKLENEVSTLLSSEYLVDESIKNDLTQSLYELSNTYSSINSNLNSINEETATIGFLIDTQQLFMTYRQQLHELNRAIKTAQHAIDQRLKLLQSQYTDEKFNEAMTNIANTLPNGQWDASKQVLLADIPNKNDVENLKTTLQEYTDGQINNLSSVLGKEIDSKINTTKSEISASISSVERKIDGIEVGGRNLLLGTLNYDYGFNNKLDSRLEKIGDKLWVKVYNDWFIQQTISTIPNETYTISFKVKPISDNTQNSIYIPVKEIDDNNNEKNISYQSFNFDKEGTFSFKVNTTTKKIRVSFLVMNSTYPNFYITDMKVEKGSVATDWTPAPEDLQRQTNQSKTEAEAAAKAYADAQDNLKETKIKAYADGIVSDEEQRAIADAIAKRDEAKEYADQKAQEAEEAANQNTSNQLEPITTRVTTNEASITELDKQISLMAKSDDVAQKLRDVDGRLAPLETTVNSNKATLDILPTQIESKVSKQDYTLDKNNIVQRLDNADSQRQQLSNEITDKVTITKFESGMKEAKNYTDNEINNLDVGSENLLLDSESRSDGANSNGFSYIRYYLTHPLEIGKTYTLKADVVTTDERQSGQTSVYPYYPNGTRDTVDIKDGKITYTFIAKAESTQFLIYKDVAGQSNVDLNVTIEKAILVEGDKVTGWSPANQDVKRQIQQSQQEAEKAAKAYTDEYKQNNDVAMTKLETSVSQLDGKVSIKVDEQKFNASQKTLSKVLTEIAATTSGINLTYDNNGTIQGVTVDNGGVKLRGDKVDITVNDEFKVMASRVNNVQASVNNKVGKDEIINRLNLSPEGLDINVNKIGIRGGNSVDYIDIRDNSILSYGKFTRTWANETDTANLRLGIQGGTVKIQNRTTGYNLYLTEKGLSTMLAGAGDETAGTLEFHSTKYNDRSRGIRMNSTYGAIALESDYSRIILNSNLTTNIESNTASVYIRPMMKNRKGTNEFRFWTKLNDTEAETDGVLSYGSLTELPDGTLDGYSFGSSIRFEKNPKSNTIYATDSTGKAGTGNFYARNFMGDLWANGIDLYAQVDNELRITDRNGYNSGNTKFKDLRVKAINTTSSYAFSNHSGADVYFGVGYHELRITANNHYNGGNPSYQDIRFGKWYAMSSEKFKYDIKEWNYSVLDAYRNDLKLYSYKYKSEKDSKYIRNHHGVIIERELPIEWRHGDGFDGNEVMFWNAKAVQELVNKYDNLESDYNDLKKEVEELKALIKKNKK